MDSFSAFAKGEQNRGKEMMVFDWHKACRLIKELKPKVVSAGLQSDWEWTGGTIWKDNKPIPQEDTEVYLSSTWAIPEIDVDGNIEDCYVMESETDGWDCHTYFPDSALELLKQKLGGI